MFGLGCILMISAKCSAQFQWIIRADEHRKTFKSFRWVSVFCFHEEKNLLSRYFLEDVILTEMWNIPKMSYLLRHYSSDDFKWNSFTAGDEKYKQPLKPKLKREIWQELSCFISDSKCNTGFAYIFPWDSWKANASAKYGFPNLIRDIMLIPNNIITHAAG